MAREPYNRYPTARELADELERFQTGRMVGASLFARRAGEALHRAQSRGDHRDRARDDRALGAGVISVRRSIASSADARAQAKEARSRALLAVREGRVELLDGEPLRALGTPQAATQARLARLDLLLGRALVDLVSRSTARVRQRRSPRRRQPRRDAAGRRVPRPREGLPNSRRQG